MATSIVGMPSVDLEPSVILVLSRLLIAALVCATARCAYADDVPLRRRADLGAAIAAPEGGEPARIVRFRPESVLAKAGLRIGDQIVAVDARPLTDATVFGATLRRLRAGDVVRIDARRGNEVLVVEIRAPSMREETIEGLVVRYGEARSERGYRVRTYTTRPVTARGRLPVVAFIPWLSCDAVEAPFGPRTDGWARMLNVVMRGVPVQFVRIEKPGVGDSEGPDCGAADLDDDLAAFRAGIPAALADPGADPQRLFLFGGSIGGALAPVLAPEFRPRGVVVSGGFSRTWYEHILGHERRRLTLSGKPPAEVNAAMKSFAELYSLVLLEGKTPRQAIAAKPGLGNVWYDGPEHQFGRPIRYYQQLQGLDVEGAWARVQVPTLVLWGANDWIMGRDDQERIIAILGARDPALATYVVRHGMNHHFDVFASLRDAFAEENGTFDEGAAQAIVEWLRARL